jgi:hypothetical protein
LGVLTAEDFQVVHRSWGLPSGRKKVASQLDLPEKAAGGTASLIGHHPLVHWPESILLPAEKKKLADLLRHIAGNPFRPDLTPPSLPATVCQLVVALDNGEACSFALHDALLEAGHADLAELFREEFWHPKPGWIVDLVIGEK